MAHRTSNKKHAPVGMTKEKTQYCIVGQYFMETLKQVPPDVNILGGQVRVGTPFTSKRVVVPTALRQRGVTYLRNTIGSDEGSIVFDQIPRAKIVDNVTYVCKALNAPLDRAYFKYLLLEKDGISGLFKRATKDILPDETDLRKKLKVMALTEGSGKVSKLIAAVHAKKYHCSIEEIVVRTIVCRD